MRAWLALAFALAAAVVVLLATQGGAALKPERRNVVAPRSHGVVRVSAAENTGGEELPWAPIAFKAPVAAYRAYAGAQLGLMETQIARLQSALSADDRSRAEAAWRGALVDYLRLGAVYLEGPVATLDQAIDGNPGGLDGGTASPRFSGLHRLEFGLWNGAPLSSLQPWARRLAADVVSLRGLLPHVQISPLVYATGRTRFSRTRFETCSAGPTCRGAARACSAPTPVSRRRSR